MNTISVIVGWVLVLLIIVLFSDVVGVVSSKIYKERTIWAGFLQRLIIIKLPLLILAIFVYVYLK